MVSMTTYDADSDLANLWDLGPECARIIGMVRLMPTILVPEEAHQYGTNDSPGSFGALM